MSAELQFRGLKGRTLEDQERAIANGYESMQDYAIDELGAIVMDLYQRVEQLERWHHARGVVTTDTNPCPWEAN